MSAVRGRTDGPQPYEFGLQHRRANEPTESDHHLHAVCSKETLKQAIAEGKALLKDGKTKFEAATAIFQRLKGADQNAVI